MICIVGMEHKGVVYLGGDSAATSGWDTRIQAAPKVFKLGEFVMGYTTSFRMGQLLQYEFTPPENDCDDDMAYMVTRFVPALRECMKKGGFTAVKESQETGGVFLVGYRGKLYKVIDEFSVLRSQDGYEAVGCGDRYALVAVWVRLRHAEQKSGQPMSPIVTLQLALEAAAYFSNGVASPFTFVRTETGQPYPTTALPKDVELKRLEAQHEENLIAVERFRDGMGDARDS